jgi:hypothetical protein
MGMRRKKREKRADLTKALQRLINGIAEQVYTVYWRYQLMKVLR